MPQAHPGHSGQRPTRSSSSSSRPGGQLTRKQRQVLTAIQRFSTVHGYMPSVRELGKELGGLAPATVQHHLTTLRRKGFLDHDGAAHGLRLSTAVGAAGRVGRALGSVAPRPASRPEPVRERAAVFPDATDELATGGDGRGGGERGPFDASLSWGLELPGMQVVVPLLGTIAAGKPLEAVEESEEYVPIPASLARGSTFVLRVAGSSMIEDAILDGDLVVVQACERVDDGEVAVVLLPDGTATLKRVHVERDRVRLQPANSEMEPIFVDSIRVRGRVAGLIRRYS